MIPQKVAQLEGVDRYKAPLVMEGGSFHADGEGTAAHHRGVPAQPRPQPAT